MSPIALTISEETKRCSSRVNNCINVEIALQFGKPSDQIFRKVPSKLNRFLRADSGFCNVDVFNACFTQNIKFVQFSHSDIFKDLLSTEFMICLFCHKETSKEDNFLCNDCFSFLKWKHNIKDAKKLISFLYSYYSSERRSLT